MKLHRTICRLGRSALVATLLLAATPAFAAAPAVEAAAARAEAAGAPGSTVERILARGAARGLPPETLVQALATVERAAARGLPVDGIADKILEGIAKGVDQARLLPVVEGMVARLRGADEALASLPATLADRPRLVEEGAEAMRRGASSDALAALAAEVTDAEVPAAQLSLAIRELGELGEERAALPMAGVALGRMAARGYAAGAMRDLSGQVAQAMAEGAAPGELLEEIAARAASGRPMDRLVDPFSERPGEVMRDPAAQHRQPRLPAARGKGLEKHPLGGPPGQSGLDRPGLPTAPGQQKRLENGRGPGSTPGKGGPGGVGTNPQGPKVPRGPGR